jgi:hypothetical protein
METVLTWPVGRTSESTRRDAPPCKPVMAYALAAALGGAASALVIAAPAAALRGISDAAAIAVAIGAAGTALAAAGLQWRGRMGRLPERRAQVPRNWLLWRHRTATAAAFGVVIGSGVLTHLKHASSYALAAVIAVAPTVEAGAIVGGLYGLSRGLTLVLTWMGDRFVARRPRWPRPGPASSRLNGMLATAALMSLPVALMLVH